MATEEELRARVGIDTTAVAKGLRSLQNQIEGVGEHISAQFSAIKSRIVEAFTVGAAIEGSRKVLEFAESIRSTSEALEISTDFLQGFRFNVAQNGGTAEAATKAIEKLSVQIGEARDGNEQAAETFTKYGVALNAAGGAALSTEHIIKRISEVLAGTKDGAERAQIAMEFFGNSGAKILPVLMQGADAMEAFTASVGKLTEDDLEKILRFKDEMESAQNALLVWGGKTVSVFAKLAQSLGGASVGFVQKLKSELRDENGKETRGLFGAFFRVLGSEYGKLDAEEANAEAAKKASREAPKPATKPRDNPEKLKREAEAFAKVVEEIQRAQFESLSDEDKLRMLLVKRHGIEIQLRDLDKNSLQFLEAQRDLIKNQNEEKELQKKITEEQVRAEKQVGDARREAFKAERALGDAREDRSQFSLEELANLRTHRGRRNRDMNADILTARQILRLEAAGRANRRNFDLSQSFFDRADELRESIGALKSNERNPFESLQERVQESNKKLDEITDSLVERGIKVREISSGD